MTVTERAGSPPQDRFEFGENWRRFLVVLDDERIARAQESLIDMLGVTTLEGKRILDAGSGSGLFSLAADRLGAEVHSFDFDHSSVACTTELRRRYGHESRWTVERGDVLDKDYLAGLGQFDVVYSWGVLHHTGDMWTALENVVGLVRPGGTLCLAIYNDQGRRSRWWTALKHRYNQLPSWLRTPYVLALVVPVEVARAVFHTLRGQPGFYLRSWTQYKTLTRGMSHWRDWVDWVGGYPFEVAKPELIFDFYRDRGFRLQAMQTCGGGGGCNEYVFIRPV